MLIYINNGWHCAWKTFGIRMGDKFLDAITEPWAYKDYITNESALEDGVRITTVDTPKVKSREVSLTLVFVGDSPEQRRSLVNGFLSLVEQNKGRIWLRVPAEEAGSPVIYRLYLVGKSGEYGMPLDRCICRMTLKFIEPNPKNRGVEDIAVTYPENY